MLHVVACNTVPASGSVTIFDSATQAGTVIAVIATGAATDHLPFPQVLDVEFKTGLSLTLSGTWDLTLSVDQT